MNAAADKYRTLWNEGIDEQIAKYSKKLENIGQQIVATFECEKAAKAELDRQYAAALVSIEAGSVTARKKLYRKRDKIVAKWCNADADRLG